MPCEILNFRIFYNLIFNSTYVHKILELDNEFLQVID
jgi:hypothetical protein